MKKQTKLMIIVAAIVAVIAIMLGVYFGTRPKPSAGGKEITVTVTHADASEADFTYQTDAEFLGEVLLAEGLVEGEDGEYGLYITSVDGEEAVYEENGAYWALYVNGEYAMTGADTTPVNDGDAFQLVYTIG